MGVALWDMSFEGVRYMVTLGHPLGSGAAVINYIRTPKLCVAAMRQFLAVMQVHFFS